MPNKGWKQVEREAAKLVARITGETGITRTPLSGSNSRHTGSDTTSALLYVEVKHRAKHTVWSLWEETAQAAKKENKLPLVLLKEKRKQGMLVVLKAEDLIGLIEAVANGTLTFSS